MLPSWKTSLFSTELNRIFIGLLINLVWIGQGILIIGIGDKKGYLDDQFEQLQKLLQNENNLDFVVDFLFSLMILRSSQTIFLELCEYLLSMWLILEKNLLNDLFFVYG